MRSEERIEQLTKERTEAVKKLLNAAGVPLPIFIELPGDEENADILEAMARARGLMPEIT